jgi:hypothetical protein
VFPVSRRLSFFSLFTKPVCTSPWSETLITKTDCEPLKSTRYIYNSFL